jgi:hypothetical protein
MKKQEMVAIGNFAILVSMIIVKYVLPTHGC